MKKQTSNTTIKILTGFCFFFLSMHLHAQLCIDGTADMVWKQTFGAGANPGPGLSPGKTGYSYSSNNCPPEGFYTIVNTINGCSPGWWDVGTCCTTDDGAYGYMMLINAANHPGVVYIDTIDLCGMNNYQLSATIINLSLPSSCSGHPAKPSLTFTIEDISGTPRFIFNTGNIPEGASGTGPNQYGFNFFAPADLHTIVIRITDNTGGTCGNVFAIDNMYLSTCGPTLIAAIQNKPGDNLNVCTGDVTPINLFATTDVSKYNHIAYQWQVYNGTDWIDIAGADNYAYSINVGTVSATYLYRVTVAERENISSAHCRLASNIITINVHDATGGTATSNSPVCINSLLNLSATGGESYQWAGPGGFTSTQGAPVLTATNNSAGQYTVVITDVYGCKNTATTIVSLNAAPNVMVSNTQNICLGDSVTLQASGGVIYAWAPVINLSDAFISNPIAKPVVTTTYKVTVTDNNHCSDTAKVIVLVNTKPVISAGEDKVIIKGQSVILNGNIKDTVNINFNWVASLSINDIHLLNPVVTPDVNTYYVLTATSGNGCGISADSVLVTVYNELYIPNAFSPNGDGLNETWNIPALQAFPNSVATVFNRYGNKIFETKGAKKDWDGTYKNSPQPAGAYVYVIDLKNKTPVKKGTVMIIR